MRDWPGTRFPTERGRLRATILQLTARVDHLPPRLANEWGRAAQRLRSSRTIPLSSSESPTASVRGAAPIVLLATTKGRRQAAIRRDVPTWLLSHADRFAQIPAIHKRLGNGSIRPEVVLHGSQHEVRQWPDAEWPFTG
jgi:hypothetical protein